MRGTLQETWVLADDRAGNTSQALGVAEALDIPFFIKKIDYTAWVKLPNSMRGTRLIGVCAASRAHLVPPWPTVVIAAGRRLSPVLRWLKKRGSPITVQLMDPGYPHSGLDIIAIPNHDNKQSLNSEIYLYTTGSPHRVTAQRLDEEAIRWRQKFSHLPRPWIAVSVGGSTKKAAFTASEATLLAQPLQALQKKTGGSLLLSTSRRTGIEATQTLLNLIPEPRFTYTWGDDSENPYFGFLALADYTVVTGDSMSMCSEATAAAAPVYIFTQMQAISEKHSRLHQELFTLGLAHPFESLLLSSPPHLPPNANRLSAAQQIAAEIHRRIDRL